MPSPPRPILKVPPSPTLMATSPLPFSSSRIPVFDSPHVHFPPTPTMTQTEITHSSFTYDRKPIVVLPNTCALPERGERAMESSTDAEHDLDLYPPSHTKRKAIKGGYFHPRAYEAVEFEAAADSDQPDQPSSLLFARDSSSLSLPYRLQNDTLYPPSHFRPVSDAGCDSTTTGSFHLNGAMDACQFIQHIPHMNLSLPFMPSKPTSLRHKTQHVKEKECSSSLKKRSTTRSRTNGTTGSMNSFERTRKVVSNAACDSGFYDIGLEGCLGGF